MGMRRAVRILGRRREGETVGREAGGPFICSVSSLVGKRLVRSRRKNHGNRKVMRAKVVERHEVHRFHKGSFGIMSVFGRKSPLFLKKIFFRFHFLSVPCVMVSPQNQKVPFSPIS